MKKITRVSDCLYLIRVSKRLSQRVVVEGAGCSVAMISCIESGKKTPSVEMIVKIAKVLEISQEAIYSCAADDLKEDIKKIWDK